MGGRIILHVDFDYFYAQCEEIRRPELKSKPIAVCVFSDRGNDSGAVATANYTARKSGIKSGMPIRTARGMQEEGTVFLPTDFGYYSDMSQKAMDVMAEFADIFEYVGRDEAYLDVTERTGGGYDRAAHLAQQIKNAIRDKTRLTCSVGVTPNKLLSKIASDYKKPDGLTVVPQDKTGSFLESLNIRDIPGIGKKTEKIFAEMGLKTVPDLQSLDVFALQQMFGRKTGTYIHRSARGINEEPVAEKEPNVQYSKIVTLKRDSDEPEFLAENIVRICAELHKIILKNNSRYKSVGIQFVHSDLSQRSRSRMLRNPTLSLAELEKNAQQLLLEALEDQKKTVRRLGVKVSELSDISGQSMMDDYIG